MVMSWKSISLISALCLFGGACGDIVKTRNPTKKLNTPEPEEKTSSLYGTCTNFQGTWTNGCDQSQFYLIQQYCDLFTIQNQPLSFDDKAVQWSTDRTAVTLETAEAGRLELQKRDGVRTGTWTRGEQICPVILR